MSPTIHLLVFWAALLVFMTTLGVTAFRSLRRSRQVAQASGVEVFLARLQPLDRHSLTRVAQEAQRPGQDLDSLDMDAAQVWHLIGGMDGLEKLAANCDVLVDLAAHLQGAYPEALPVAEQLRRDAREIRWHLERLRGAASRGHLESAFPDYAERAVALYCSMTEYLVALYQQSQSPELAALQAAL